MSQTHTVLVVKIVGGGTLTDEQSVAYIDHAAATIGLAHGWFDYGPRGNSPTTALRFSDGTYKIHVPSSDNLLIIRDMMLEHEGLELVREETEEGDGFHPFDIIDSIERE